MKIKFKLIMKGLAESRLKGLNIRNLE